MHLVILQAAAAGQGGGIGGTLIMFALMFAVIYFLMIRPQQKKQKELQAMLTNLKVHDTIVTSGGIIGKIVSLKPEKDTVVIRVDDQTGAKIEIQRQAIAGVIVSENKEPAQG
jgi:preprotein translocase subunit YajC